jgi:hypothetical protein
MSVQHFSIKEFVFLHPCGFESINATGRSRHASPEKQRESTLGARNPTLPRTLLNATPMSFAAVVDRVRVDFVEMPEMELTLPQAVRLWSLGMDDCRYVIDSLVDAGFLAWTPKRTIVRKGRDPLSRQDTRTANVSVLVTKPHNKSVWNG